MNTVTPIAPGPVGSLRKIEKYSQAIVPNPTNHKPSSVPFTTAHIKNPLSSKKTGGDILQNPLPSFPAPCFLSEAAHRGQHSNLIRRNLTSTRVFGVNGVVRSKPHKENIVRNPARTG